MIEPRGELNGAMLIEHWDGSEAMGAEIGVEGEKKLEVPKK